uniref:Guanylate cyclase domain-containing protein n=1 Tax=Chromera velia CCMP2878 TaxID=1169474 RepID=A0A0G4GKS6_9ALVE|eukprot:Cvel_4838.t1-p1 / transcript=Cvel_4838.t1 / gene=Cvel_4838 / organism=Chromera_velia_CCMP2878 / gene_product=Atrial natriuretic peptide receptor 2, putative / transcript_product=Atrial natriuretic peptide receptor 2, putative / location=Cvel_scaffold218:33894-38267(+) / protein_length=920 / sequence_SO=supercontig / SO=protein_coding / is_pseudo=false
MENDLGHPCAVSSTLSQFVGVVETGGLLLGCVCVFLLNLAYTWRGRKKHELERYLGQSVLVSALLAGGFAALLRRKVTQDLQHVIDLFICLTFGCSLLASFLLRPPGAPPTSHQGSSLATGRRKKRAVTIEETHADAKGLTSRILQSKETEPTKEKEGVETPSPLLLQDGRTKEKDEEEDDNRPPHISLLQKSDSHDTEWLTRSSKKNTPRKIKKRLGKLLQRKLTADELNVKASTEELLEVESEDSADKDGDGEETEDEQEKNFADGNESGRSKSETGEKEIDSMTLYPDFLKNHFNLPRERQQTTETETGVAAAAAADAVSTTMHTEIELNALGLPPRPEMLMQFLQAQLALTEGCLREALKPLPEGENPVIVLACNNEKVVAECEETMRAGGYEVISTPSATEAINMVANRAGLPIPVDTESEKCFDNSETTVLSPEASHLDVSCSHPGSPHQDAGSPMKILPPPDIGTVSLPCLTDSRTLAMASLEPTNVDLTSPRNSVLSPRCILSPKTSTLHFPGTDSGRQGGTSFSPTGCSSRRVSSTIASPASLGLPFFASPPGVSRRLSSQKSLSSQQRKVPSKQRKDFRVPDLLIIFDENDDMDALEATKEVRKSLPGNFLKILVCFLEGALDVKRAFELGVSEVQRRPFQPHILFQRARALAAQRELLVKLLVEATRKGQLLSSILPEKVARRLQMGEAQLADSHPEVSLFFSDVCGFTHMSASVPTREVVVFLNRLFCTMDVISDHCEVFKVETIGDAYMAACGHLEGQTDHAKRLLKFARLVRRTARTIRMPTGTTLKVRIGLNSGPAYTGVVGLKCPRFCFFGDTVNTAARMEQTGLPGHIHVSESFRYAALSQDPALSSHFAERADPVIAKGKGKLRTFWVLPGPPHPELEDREKGTAAVENTSAPSKECGGLGN